MTADPLAAIATFAAIIVLGFLGYLLFERTRITDVLILIGFGVLIGPVLGVFDVEGFKAATPLVGTLALIIIMFDGGLSLRLRDLLSGIAKSTVLAFAGFTVTVAAVAVGGHHFLGLSWLTAALLGTVVGGTSGVIVMPILQQTSARKDTRVLLSVESALTDVLCVIGAVTLIALIVEAGGVLGPDQLKGALTTVTSQFSTAIVLGLFAGFTWLRLLKLIQNKRNSYMITLAATLMLYVGAETLGGNGAIAVLIFGIVLGNGYALSRKFDIEGLEFTDEQRHFHGEISFLVRVFFFVYLGVILDPGLFTDPQLLVAGGVLLAAILLARGLVVTLVTGRAREVAGDRKLIAFLMPRGLAAAVLAGLPAQHGIPGTENFVAYAFMVVAATNLVGTGTVLVYETTRKRQADVVAEAEAALAVR